MSSTVDRFASGYPFALDDFQRQACEQVAVGRSVLVAAPTGSGKTVVGEFACWQALMAGGKCFYTTPIKALSNQKYHDLVAKHGAEQVGLLTGDVSVNGNAPLVVMTTEVLRNMIYLASDTLTGLRFVVMDEVHYLADRFRGAVWEEVILGLADSVALIALSATVSNAEEFGEWLDEVRGEVAVVVSERRPVPLFQHVMVGPVLHDLFDDAGTGVNPKLMKLAQQESRAVRDDSRRPRGGGGRGQRSVSYGSGSFGGAARVRAGQSDRGGRRDQDDRGRGADGQHRGGGDSAAQGVQALRPPSRATVVEKLRAAGLLPAIVFTFSRQGCDGAVRQLLGSGVHLTTRAERTELLRIAESHAAGLSEADRQALDWSTFIEALGRGISAHHAGLLPTFKAIVEEGFTRGLIKVVHATETLALGINMPAKTVVIEKLVKYNGEIHADITPGEYTQLTGRAGRRGIDVEGHAVVLWQPGMDPRAVAGLASRRTYPLRSSFAPNYNMAVNLVGSIGRVRARSLLEQSFAQFQTDRSVVAMARSSAGTQNQIRELWASAQCKSGDFTEYARLRDQISGLEAETARLRRHDKRAEAYDALIKLEPGDLFWVPAGKHQGWAVAVEVTVGRREPHPLVMDENFQVARLTMADFPEPIRIISRVRIPRKFDPRSAAARKELAASFRQRLASLNLDLAPVEDPKRDAELVSQIADLRARLQTHPAHRCPDREQHARWAEQALRLERDLSRSRNRADQRSNSIATKFDRICNVLAALGYLAGSDADDVTEAGRLLARIYNELDLVVAECVRDGVFNGLSTPQLAAVLSSLVYESRSTETGRPVRMPDRASEAAQSLVRAAWRRVGEVERDFKVERSQAPDIGFAGAAFAWADGESLAMVLDQTGLPAGDVVRWIRQVIDLAAQVAAAPGVDDLRARGRQVVVAMRRDIVDFETD